jgi:hypothetical protein
MKLKAKPEDRTLRLSQGTCSYICIYINAFADSVMLYLQHDFYNMIFKIEPRLYIASGSVPPPPNPKRKILGAHLAICIQLNATYIRLCEIRDFYRDDYDDHCHFCVVTPCSFVSRCVSGVMSRNTVMFGIN